MKKIALLYVFIAILISVSANAEMVSIGELYQQAELFGNWTQTYEAHGRTIEVDVPVSIPDTDNCSVVTVNMAIPLTDEQVSMIDTKGMLSGKSALLDYHFLMNEENPENHLVVMLGNRTVDLADPMGREEIWVYRGKFDSLLMSKPASKGAMYPVMFYRAWKTDMNAALAEGNEVTPNDVILKMKGFLNEVYPQTEILFAPRRFRAIGMERKEIDKREGKTMWTEFGDRVESNDTPGYIGLDANQIVNGIPVLGTMCKYVKYEPKEWMKVGKKIDQLSVMEPYLELEYRNDSSYYFRAKTLNTAMAIEDDIPLASLDAIIKTIENEIMSGHIRAIFEINLGYVMCLMDDDKVGLFPIWEVLCGYESSVSKEWETETRFAGENGVDSFESLTRMAINAQTGELIDPGKFDSEQLYIPKIITWENCF